MKFFLLVVISLTSFNIFSKSVSKRRLDEMEQRISSLESKVSKLMSQKSITSLKIKDSNNKIVQAGLSRDISSENKLSDEQQKSVMKQIERIKRSKEESQKIIDEIMNENH
ncbi:MAG: hypothetical protein HON90_07780 [Halobacteriovoraceae bacterium]|jgi:hypothetical protein|nr:hypothetical protein [Halobacteriovoraceae bacterium]